MGLGCPEALKEGPHMGSLKGKSSMQGASCKYFFWASTSQDRGQDGKENSIGGGEENIFLGLESGKLVGENTSQIWLLCALCRDPSHGPLT